jgi:hypothetical protein
MPKRTNRRTFLKLSAAAASVGAAGLANAFPAGRRIVVVTDEDSPVVKSESVQWALSKLRKAIAGNLLANRGPGSELTLRIAPVSSPLAKVFANLPTFTTPEATALIPGFDKVLLTGSDARGITYAILEVADRIRFSDDPVNVLSLPGPIVETTPNKVRSVLRAFCSEIEDKAWFYDRAFWTNYLDTLAAARFNRFNFSLGMGWDFPRGVTGDYLHFPYPYLVELPGLSPASVSAISKRFSSSPRRPRAGASTSSSAYGPTRISGPTARTPTTTSPGSLRRRTRLIAGTLLPPC